MWSKKEIIIFIAGAQTFHTITHIFLTVTGSLPMQIFSFTITQQFNVMAIIINVLVTIGLFWWISRLQ